MLVYNNRLEFTGVLSSYAADNVFGGKMDGGVGAGGGWAVQHREEGGWCRGLVEAVLVVLAAVEVQELAALVVAGAAAGVLAAAASTSA